MGLFDFFKSDEEKVRSKIRKGFDGCVRTAVKSLTNLMAHTLSYIFAEHIPLLVSNVF